MITIRILLTLLLGAAIALADTLVLKNGLTLEGTFKSGTEKSIRFETSGKIQEVALSEVKSIIFGSGEKEAHSGGVALPTTSAGVAGKAGEAVIIPAGTKIMVRTQEAIEAGGTPKGTRITAVLEKNIEIGNEIAIPRGSLVYGRVLDSIGKRRTDLKRILIGFDQLIMNDRSVDINTDEVGLEQKEGGKVENIGSGGMMGGGIGTPANVSLTGNTEQSESGKHLQIEAKTLLVVSLKNDIRLR